MMMCIDAFSRLVDLRFSRSTSNKNKELSNADTASKRHHATRMFIFLE